MNGPGQQKVNMQDISRLVQCLISENGIISSQQKYQNLKNGLLKNPIPKFQIIQLQLLIGMHHYLINQVCKKEIDLKIDRNNFLRLVFFEIEVNTSCLTIEELKQKLKDYDIDTTDINNRVVLAEILQNILDDETLEQNKGRYFCL